METSIAKRGEEGPSLHQSHHKKYIRAQISLRALAAMATFAASLSMALNKETTNFGGFQITATYKTSPAFQFFVVGNAVAGGYSLVSVPFIHRFMVGAFSLPLLDLVGMVLVMASASAATAIAYVGKRGNNDIGWSMVCPYFEKFCERVGISILLSFLAVLLFLCISSLTSVYKTKLAVSSA